MYSVRILIEGIEKRKRMAGSSHVVIGLFLILKVADYYRLLHYDHFSFTVPFYVAACISLWYGFFRKRLDGTARYNPQVRMIQAIAFIVLGVVMTGSGRTVDYISCFLWAGLCLLLLLTERKVFNETNLLMDTTGIILPGYYADHLVAWDDIEDMIVRKDYITIFHIKDKYLQYTVLQSLSDLEITRLNSFCKEQIKLSRQDAINSKIHLN